MTAVNIIRQTNAIHMVTDGILKSGETGMDAHNLTSKVITLPHLNAAIAVSGPIGANYMLSMESANLRSYEELRLNIGNLMRHCEQTYPKFMRTELEPDYEVYCIGWSAKTGPDYFWAISHDRRPGVPAYVALQSRNVLMQPVTDAIAADANTVLAADLDDVDPASAGPVLIDIQRRHLNNDYPDRLGGLAALTSITSDRIVSRIVGRWPQHLEIAK